MSRNVDRFEGTINNLIYPNGTTLLLDLVTHGLWGSLVLEAHGTTILQMMRATQ